MSVDCNMSRLMSSSIYVAVMVIVIGIHRTGLFSATGYMYVSFGNKFILCTMSKNPELNNNHNVTYEYDSLIRNLTSSGSAWFGIAV